MAAQSKQQGGRVKHVPQRTCIACRATQTKRGLIRLVRTADGYVEVDPTGKRHGRGAYLCHNTACWEQAIKRHTLERALRVDSLSADNQRDLLLFVQTLLATNEAASLPDGVDVAPQNVGD